MTEPIVITAEFDESSIGTTRNHYVIPAKPKEGYAKATVPKITGGIYISKDEPVPDSIVIVFPARAGELKAVEEVVKPKEARPSRKRTDKKDQE